MNGHHGRWYTESARGTARAGRQRLIEQHSEHARVAVLPRLLAHAVGRVLLHRQAALQAEGVVGVADEGDCCSSGILRDPPGPEKNTAGPWPSLPFPA